MAKSSNANSSTTSPSKMAQNTLVTMFLKQSPQKAATEETEDKIQPAEPVLPESPQEEERKSAVVEEVEMTEEPVIPP